VFGRLLRSSLNKCSVAKTGEFWPGSRRRIGSDLGEIVGDPATKSLAKRTGFRRYELFNGLSGGMKGGMLLV
jgi:hypothetical protein